MMSSNDNIEAVIATIPQGYSNIKYRNKRYGVTRTDFNKGKSTKIYAEELGGSDHISFNFYRIENRNLLKPCEMSDEKVLNFLVDMKF